MKKITLICCIAICFSFCINAIAQPAKPLFDSTYYGFNTGSYPNGQSPSALKSADIDNDGDSDIVVAQQNFSNGFVVLKNLKKGFYASPVKYNSTGASKDIVVADFNNDGFKDVALTNTGQSFDGNTVSVFINRGNGAFKKPENFVVGRGPVGIVAADFDNDGDIDIAVANYRANNGTVSVLINAGSNGFNTALTFPAGTTPFRIAAARINNDSLIDIVVANENQKVNVLYNGGNNDFSNKQVLFSF